MDKLNLLLAIHCHQPVGNFGIVFSKAYEAAYLPFIEALEKHPNIGVSLHYSGSLLDWLELTHPEFLKKIKGLVKRQQIEILAGGYYEPILSLIPQSDAQAQIEMLKVRIKDLFAFQADGCWLSERIWEPKLPSILNKAGIKWTIVDDSHFKSAGLIPENLSGYYISEDEGSPLTIFPASERLRYLMPFKLPEETIDYLKNLYERKIRCVCFADDGEKFGLWPGTNKWVYEEKWLKNFFIALEENASWLRIIGFSQYLNEYPPAARIYLNCASYREMMDWSGGYFRNFLLKYEEANWMHKRMLYVSKEIEKVRRSGGQEATRKEHKNSKLDRARRHLYMAQCNDAYWHGVFGGLYLNHLRSCVYSHIIEAEKAIRNLRKCKIDVLDLDYDGQTEIILSTKRLSCVFAPHRGGALLELDYKPKSINLINTLMRRRETYHQKLKEKITNAKAGQSEPQSIHHLDRVKQGNLKNFLFYDLFPRYCCLDHFLDKHTSLEQFLRSEYIELGDFIQGQYSWSQGAKSKNKIGLRFQRSGKAADCPIKLTKKISLIDNDLALEYTVKNESKDYVTNLFGIEFNLSVYDNQLSSVCREVKAEHLRINDAWNEISLEFNVSSPASVWHFPVETISDSETGIEKTYQELCLLFNWQLDIAPYSDWSIKLGLRIKDL